MSPSSSQDTARLAQLMSHDASVRLAFLSVGGWDTHVNQGANKGQLANHLHDFGDGLTVLVQGLGKRYADTVILVMSEFGPTFHENGNGGKVHGQWPGLDNEQLYRQRDLAVTTDFRQVAGTVLTRHLHLPATGLDQVFPDGMGKAADLSGLLHS